jgi:hypothetical protein
MLGQCEKSLPELTVLMGAAGFGWIMPVGNRGIYQGNTMCGIPGCVKTLSLGAVGDIPYRGQYPENGREYQRTGIKRQFQHQ